LKIETKDLENRQVELTVEVPPEQRISAMRRAARQMAKQAKIPGFRPGKAPFEVILGRFGEEEVFETALEGLTQEAYKKALDSVDLDPIGPGSLEEIISNDPLVMRFIVPLQPEVELGAYEDIRVPYEAPEITDETVENVMEEIRLSQALIEPVERAAQTSDVVVIDVSGELLDVDDEQEDATLLDENAISILIDEKTDWPIPGIAEHLVGAEVGAELDFEHTFDEEYSNESLQGKRAKFHLTVREVKSRTIPEWSDELARNVSDSDDLLALRIRVREDLLKEATRRAENAYANEVVDAFLDIAEIDYPPVMLEEEISDMLRDLEGRLRAQNLGLEDYMKIEGKSFEDMREELTPDACARLERGLLLGHIVDIKGLTIQDDEIEAEIDRLSESLGDNPQNTRMLFDTPNGRRRIHMELLTQKAIKWLTSIAKGEAEEAEEEQAQEVPEPKDKPQTGAGDAQEELAAENDTDESQADTGDAQEEPAVENVTDEAEEDEQASEESEIPEE